MGNPRADSVPIGAEALTEASLEICFLERAHECVPVGDTAYGVEQGEPRAREQAHADRLHDARDRHGIAHESIRPRRRSGAPYYTLNFEEPT